MDSGWTQELLAWISANPGWSGVVLFTISLVESLVLIGFLVPGIIILFGIGTLIGLSMAELWPIWIGGSLGAMCGDLLSFYVGRRYGMHLREVWPFSKYPGVFERGHDFFRNHGAKSVLAGRFIGPLRPVIPATAGMLGMRASRFAGIAVLGAVLWTPAYLIPGMLFGASLEVASEYAGRLTLVLLLLVTILWLSLWVIGKLYALSAAYSARWMRRAIHWSRRHPVLGRLTGSLLDPAQPELLSVTMLGLLLVAALWGFVLLLFLSPFGEQPKFIDLAVMEWMHSMRNHIADPYMVAVSQLSALWVLLPTAFATLLWLLGAQRLSAATHWLVAIAGGMVLQLLMSWSLRATPVIFDAGDEDLYLPSAAMTLAAVVLGFFAVMVARELRRRARKWPYMACTLLLTLLLWARVYLGLDWLSGALIGGALGLAWTAIVGIAYRQRAQQPFAGWLAICIFFGTLLTTLVWQFEVHRDEDLATLALPLPQRSMTAAHWWQDGWREMPAERTRLQSVPARQFNLQVALDPEQLREALAASGWQDAPAAGWQWALQALNPDPDRASLPLTSKDFLGHREALRLQRSAHAPGEQWTLRLWDSGTRLEPGDRVLYLGQLSREVLVQRLHLFSYWRAQPVANEVLEQFTRAWPGVIDRRPQPGLVLMLPEGDPAASATDAAGAAPDH